MNTFTFGTGNKLSNHDCPINCVIYSGRGVGGGVGVRGGGEGDGIGEGDSVGDLDLGFGAIIFCTFI